MEWIIFVLALFGSCTRTEGTQPSATVPLKETTLLNEIDPVIKIVAPVHTTPLNDTTSLNKTSPLNGTTPENQSPQPVSQDKNIIDWFTGLFSFITGNTNSGPSTSTNAGSSANSAEREPVPSKSCPSCRCGESQTSNRVVNGQETKDHEFPWIAALSYSGKFHCGGSIIAKNYVLTAGHCIEKGETMELSLMNHDRSDPDKTMAFSRMSSDIILHPEFDPKTLDNDIALVKLSEPLDFSQGDKLKDGKEHPGVKPVCLATRGQSYVGFDAIVTGWGATEDNILASPTQVLRKVTVPILSTAECEKTKVKDRITKNMLCAGFKEGGRDACKGDSGGPLLILNSDGRYQQIGIVSWGDGCARPDEPGVYTRLTRYLDWIKQQTKGECFCQ